MELFQHPFLDNMTLSPTQHKPSGQELLVDDYREVGSSCLSGIKESRNSHLTMASSEAEMWVSSETSCATLVPKALQKSWTKEYALICLDHPMLLQYFQTYSQSLPGVLVAPRHNTADLSAIPALADVSRVCHYKLVLNDI